MPQIPPVQNVQINISYLQINFYAKQIQALTTAVLITPYIVNNVQLDIISLAVIFMNILKK